MVVSAVALVSARRPPESADACSRCSLFSLFADSSLTASTYSTAEVARYLELYKQFERKPPDLIKQRTDDSYIAHLTQALTSVRGVNKTDVTTLASHFGVSLLAPSLLRIRIRFQLAVCLRAAMMTADNVMCSAATKTVLRSHSPSYPRRTQFSPRLGRQESQAAQRRV